MTEPDEQPAFEVLVPALAGARATAKAASARTRAKERRARPVEPAPSLPVAQVLVDVPLAHLDRPFDYLVPAGMHEQVVAGSRVKVRFAGQDVDGFVLGRVEESEHPGRLAYLRRSVSAEPVLSPEVARLSGAVAERYAGTRSDVLRLAIPPRHAATEKQPSVPAPAGVLDPGAARGWWSRYTGGAELVDGLAALPAADAAADRTPPRAVWTALPGEDWAQGFAHAAAAALGAGRGSVLCVPDRRDLDRLDEALTRVLGPGCHVLLTADLGPAERYRAFLAVARGAVRVVAGTRAAAFAPVHALGLVATWDDGDDLYAEPRAPYPHTREVLLLRAHEQGCAAILGGHARSVEAAALVATGWARAVTAPRELVRSSAPLVAITGATDVELARDPAARAARLPSTAHAAIRSGLEQGPVLVQTPRLGYAAALACDTCRTPARCRVCSGPLHQPTATAPPGCRWCGAVEVDHTCAVCGAHGLRAPVLGDRRTAEELGRAFPGARVRRSSGDRVLDEVDDRPAIVVATPGAEPVAAGGYAAVVLLDTWLMLGRPDLRTGEESVRRWFNAAALARPADRGGRVVAVGEPSEPTLQALVRWDPGGYAARESEERRSAHLPPASRLAVLNGDEDALDSALAELRLPAGAEVLGPVPDPGTTVRPAPDEPERMRLVIRVPRRAGPALSRALREMQGVRSTRKLSPVRVQVDPYSLG